MNAPDHSHSPPPRRELQTTLASRGVAVLLLLFLVVAALPGMTLLAPAHPGLAVAVTPERYPSAVATTVVDRLLSGLLLEEDQLVIDASLGADLEDYVQQVADLLAVPGEERVQLVIRKSLPEPAAGQLVEILDTYLDYHQAVPKPHQTDLDELVKIQVRVFGEDYAERLFGPYNQMRRMMEASFGPDQ